MGDDSGKIWTLSLQILYVVKMEYRLHYVSLTSKAKRDETLRQETLRKWTWWLSDGLLALH